MHFTLNALPELIHALFLVWTQSRVLGTYFWHALDRLSTCQKSHRGRKMFVLGIHTLRARSNVRPLAGSSFISYISGQSFPVTLVQCDSYRLQVWDEYLWKYSYQAPTSSRSCRVLKWKAEWLAKIRLPSGSQAIPFNTSGPSRPAAFASAAAPRIGSQAVARLGPKVQFV